MEIILPFLVFWPIAGSLISYLIGRRNKHTRDYFASFVTVAEFVAAAIPLGPIAAGAELHFHWRNFCGQGLYFKLDGFRAIYALISAFMWMMTTVFSGEYFRHYSNRNRYYLFCLATLGATMGVFLSADLYTTFIFFEVMSLTSYVMVVHNEKPLTMRAGDTYIAVAIIGGIVTLMGILLLYRIAGTLVISELAHAAVNIHDKTPLYAAGALIMVGFGAKAGMFPLHIWLPKAHPVAPAPASALLSGVLTKTGVFGVLVVSCNIFMHDTTWSTAILPLGVITMFLGALMAVFSIDFKRTLACSSVSQIGFILTGVAMQGFLGDHNALAVRGTLLHMVNHSLIKLVLFMCAGVVYVNLHKLDLNEIRGFGRDKPLLKACFLMGVLGITGMPLWNGYVSKALLHESIVEYIWLFPGHVPKARFFQIVEAIFTLSGGMTAAYMTKLFVAVFIEKNPYDQGAMDASNKKYINSPAAFAIASSAIILPILGLLPYFTMDKIGQFGQGFMHGHDPEQAVEYFVWQNLKGAFASLAIGAIVYTIVIRGILARRDENNNLIYVDAWPSKIDLEDLIYRPALKGLAATCTLLCRVFDILMDKVIVPWSLLMGGFAARSTDILTDKIIVPGSLLMGELAAKSTDALANKIIVSVDKSLFHTAKAPHTLIDRDAGIDINRAKPAEQSRVTVFRSLSFSLLLFGAGLCASLFYLLIAGYR